jgi:hypothetical protein
MRIAFDVMGTLENGPRRTALRYALAQLYHAGHEIFVWSNEFSYANKVANEFELHGIEVKPLSKYAKFQASEGLGEMMDVAFEDDTSQKYLAANKFYFVHELPDNGKEIVQKVLEHFAALSTNATNTIIG